MIPANLTPLANHLWQSTLLAATAGLLSLVLRKQRAQVRYGLWLAASVKFLIPFALLVSMGSQFEWRTATSIAQSPFPVAMEEISQPFAPSATAPLLAVPSAASPVSAVLLAIWVCGFTAVVFSWIFGGPIKIPHLIRNGPVFFINYQWTRNRNDTNATGLMPTIAERNGEWRRGTQSACATRVARTLVFAAFALLRTHGIPMLKVFRRQPTRILAMGVSLAYGSISKESTQRSDYKDQPRRHHGPCRGQGRQEHNRQRDHAPERGRHEAQEG